MIVLLNDSINASYSVSTLKKSVEKDKNGFKENELKIFVGAFELKEMVPNYYVQP